MKPVLWRTFLTLALLLTGLLLAAASCEPAPPGSITPTSSSPPESITVYFTDPTDPDASTYRGGIDDLLVAAIDDAQAAVDMAIFDLNLWSVRDALIAAHQRGVRVRMVTESDNLDEPEMQELLAAGIEILGDRSEGLMHNKFVIIDRWEVWTGSTNLTTGGAYLNDNNLLRIRSTRLAQDYTTEFEEMFVSDAFGPGSPANTPNPTVSLDGILVEVYFSPEDGALSRLVTLVSGAQHSVYFLAYSFTSDELAAALLERAAAGIQVAGVFEEDQYNSNIGTEFDNLLAAGLDVRLDGNPSHMHHKVLIIDEQVVVTGSYNFSNNAEERNDENLLIIHDSGLAAQFLSEFNRVYNLAIP